MSLRTRAARGTIVNSGFTVSLGVLTLVKSFILAGFVSRADYGLWGVLIVTLNTLLFLKQVGVGDKFVQQQESDQAAAFQRAFTLELGLSGALVVVLVALVPLIVVVYDQPRLIAPSAVVAVTLLVSAFQAPQWIYLREMRYARQRALAAIDPLVSFIVSVLLAAAGAGYWAFVGGLAAGVCASALASAIACPYPLRLRYDAGTLRSYVSFSAPLMTASIAILVMSWVALIVTRLSLGMAAVGVVTLTSTIQAFTDSADQVVTGALYPAICRVRDQVPLLHESFVKSNRLALMWAVPFGVGLTLFSGDLVRFGIGERWRPAVVVLQLSGITAALGHVGFNWTAYLRARGETRPIAMAALAAAGSFLLFGVPLLLAFGLPGYAVGLVLQTVAAFLVRAWSLRRVFPGFVPLRHLSRAFLPTVPAAAAVLLARVLAGGASTVGWALAELAVYIAVTAVVTWRVEGGLLREAASAVRGRQPVVPVAG